MKKTILSALGILALLFFLSSSAWAITYTVEDTWDYFPGYPDSSISPVYGDEIGTPHVEKTFITINDVTKKLEKIEIQVVDRQVWDSLFLNLDWTNEAWDSWDYMIRDNTDGYGTAPNDFPGYLDQEGVYEVTDNYDYTFVPTTSNYDRRDGNPNGVNATDLDYLNNDVSVDWLDTNGDGEKDLLVYDFSSVSFVVGDNFYFAYTPWCANDVTGGAAPVPEPATIILMGLGLLGIAGTARKRFVK